jgi:hypothetical protein
VVCFSLNGHSSFTDYPRLPKASLLSDEVASKKKKILNEAEMALRREETARKRKNMTEKRLADEKASAFDLFSLAFNSFVSVFRMWSEARMQF